VADNANARPTLYCKMVAFVRAENVEGATVPIILAGPKIGTHFSYARKA